MATLSTSFLSNIHPKIQEELFRKMDMDNRGNDDSQDVRACWVKMTSGAGGKDENVDPIILMGGVGKINHFLEAFKNEKIQAIATANLLNFIGDTFLNLRKNLLLDNIDVVDWGENNLLEFKNIFND